MSMGETRGPGGRAGGRRGARRDRWMVSYADLMTVLFALFVVLFARAYGKTGFAAVKADMARREVSREGRARLRGQLGDALREDVARGTVALGESPEGIVVRLTEMGSFASGEALPLPAAAAVAERMAGVVARAGLPVRVEGHTDDQALRTGAFRSNWELSTARAEAILGLLLQHPGMAPGQMSVAGYGAYRPVASNATEEGRRANRRVDLVVVCPP